jgi:1-acyl-sn-glycerol-3-phosphate acyltransferase
MTWLRSLAFNIVFYVWTVIMVMVCTPLLALPRRFILAAMAFWGRGVDRLMWVVAAIRVEVRGQHLLPAGPYIIAAKHQSAWDTIYWHSGAADPAVVMKHELLFIPFYGLFALKVGMIPVDRSAGSSAMRSLLKGAKRAAAVGRPVVIFPQGTRVAPGVAAPYQPGVAALYKALNCPVVPVALNSGVFWPRRRFLRRPGTLVLEYLDPIPPGLDRPTFMAELERRIETASDALVAAADEYRRG